MSRYRPPARTCRQISRAAATASPSAARTAATLPLSRPKQASMAARTGGHRAGDGGGKGVRAWRDARVERAKRVAFAQLAKSREQALATEHRKHPQPQSQQRDIVRLAFDCAGQRFHMRIHRLIKCLPFIGQLHRLARAGEQFFPDEFFEIADPA